MHPSHHGTTLFMEIAASPSAGSALDRAIASVRLHWMVPSEVQRILRSWTSTDGFYALFGRAHSGERVGDDQFARLLSASPDLAMHANAEAIAAELVDALGRSWLSVLRVNHEPRDVHGKAVPGVTNTAPEDVARRLSLVVTIVAALGVLTGVFLVVAVLGMMAMLFVGPAATDIPGLSTFFAVLLLFGVALAVLHTWFSYQLFVRAPWTRIVALVMSICTVVGAATTILAQPSIATFLALVLNGGFAWVLTQPSVVAEFQGPPRQTA